MSLQPPAPARTYIMKTWLIAFTLLLTASFSVADALTLKPGAPTVYVVKKGDTLWGIAKRASVSVDELVSTNDINKKDVLKLVKL